MGNPQVLKAVQQSVTADEPNAIKRAGKELAEWVEKDQRSTVETLCEILEAGAKEVDPTTRLGATLFLKNTVKQRWDLEGGVMPETRILLRQRLVPILMNSPANIRAVLLDVLDVMARTDVPFEWPNLLNSLINEYIRPFLASATQNPALANIDLGSVAVDITFQALAKYETADRSNETLLQLKHILALTQEPFLHLFLWSSEAYRKLLEPASGIENTPPTLNRALLLSRMTTSSLRLIKCLHGVDLPEYFEDNLPKFIPQVFALLRQPPNLAADNASSSIEGQPTPSDLMKTVATEFVKEYVTKYSEEYMPYVIEGTQSLLQALQGCTPRLEQDTLVGTLMNCLASTAAVIWGPECDPFVHIPNLLSTLCGDLLLKNITLREDDIEAVQDEPLQYTREDLEGMQRGARREGAAELIKALLQRREVETCNILMNTIQVMLAEAHNDQSGRTKQERMLLKEAATYLVICISVKSSTRAKGITEVNNLVPIGEYLKTELLTVLFDTTSHDPEAALAKGSAIKFVCMFRRFVPPEHLAELLPCLVAHLGSPNVYIYTNAAAALERLLTPKGPGESYIDRSNEATMRQLASAIAPLMGAIRGRVTALDNEYVMRCLWRLLAIVPCDVNVQAERLKEMVNLLQQVTKTPVNPIFCHYLFEAVAALCRIVSTAVGVSTAGLELHNFIVMIIASCISEEECHSFVPYGYQILAGLISTLPTEEPQASVEKASWQRLYGAIYEGVLAEDRWKASHANVPAIMMLVTQFLNHPWILSEGLQARKTQDMFRLFNTALGISRLNSRTVFEFLNVLIVTLPAELVKVYMSPVISCILSYLNKRSESAIAIQCAAVSLCGLQIKADLAAGGFGKSATDPSANVPGVLNSEQGRLDRIIADVILPTTEGVISVPERKVVLAGVASFMTNPLILHSSYGATFRNTVPYLTGEIRKDESTISRTQKLATETAEDARARLLHAMANEDEKGAADMSSSYNRLVTVTGGQSSETVLTKLVPDEHLKQLLGGVATPSA